MNYNVSSEILNSTQLLSSVSATMVSTASYILTVRLQTVDIIQLLTVVTVKNGSSCYSTHSTPLI